jgi:hypothetical protein
MDVLKTATGTNVTNKVSRAKEAAHFSVRRFRM